MNKNEKKITNMIFSHYNNIIKACEIIGKKWGTNQIPLTTFEQVIKRAYLNEDSDYKEFAVNVNKTINGLYSTCLQASKDFGTTTVTIEFIKHCVQVIKQSYKEGLTNKK
jgi:Ni,Fe-hydrogenase III component G